MFLPRFLGLWWSAVNPEEAVRKVLEKEKEGRPFKELKVTWSGVHTNGHPYHPRYWYVVTIKGRRRWKRDFEEIVSYEVPCGMCASHYEIREIAWMLEQHGFKKIVEFNGLGYHAITLRR